MVGSPLCHYLLLYCTVRYGGSVVEVGFSFYSGLSDADWCLVVFLAVEQPISAFTVLFVVSRTVKSQSNPQSFLLSYCIVG